jgi:hypothetical protein
VLESQSSKFFVEATMPAETFVDMSEAAIFSRVIDPDENTLTPEAVASILRMDFSRADRERMCMLSEKASEGTLTPEEDRALENYVQVNHLLTIIQSKARRSIQKSMHPSL